MKKIEATIKSAFLSTLKHPLSGYSNSTALDIMNRSYWIHEAKYKINLEENRVTMMKSYDT